MEGQRGGLAQTGEAGPYSALPSAFPTNSSRGIVDEFASCGLAFLSQEPVNAHSHLLSMLLGNSLAVPVAGGDLQLGTWQSIILVELDGPRTRTVGVQVMGL